MLNTNRIDRRSALLGAAVGLGSLALLAGAMGVGAGGLAGDRVVSWGGDGRQAYLWAIEGDQIRFLSSARANEPGNDNKPGDKDKGPDADKGGGKDKDKDKDKDGGESGKGKGKGKG